MRVPPFLRSSLLTTMPAVYYRFFVERQPRVYPLPPGATGCTLRELVDHLAATGHADLRHVRFEFQYADEADLRVPRLSSVCDGNVFVPANRTLIVRRAPRVTHRPLDCYGGVVVR